MKTGLNFERSIIAKFCRYDIKNISVTIEKKRSPKFSLCNPSLLVPSLFAQPQFIHLQFQCHKNQIFVVLFHKFLMQSGDGGGKWVANSEARNSSTEKFVKSEKDGIDGFSGDRSMHSRGECGTDWTTSFHSDSFKNALGTTSTPQSRPQQQNNEQIQS